MRLMERALLYHSAIAFASARRLRSRDAIGSGGGA
jgi:hypothetical protein